MQTYHVIVRKHWFRQKPVFTYKLSDYERRLSEVDKVNMSFNAGNMIYLMMSRLTKADWKKQEALIFAYRNLVFKLSYVDIVWQKDNINVLHLLGEKNDVMWALSFLSQVFPDNQIDCETIPETENHTFIKFSIQNGNYVGAMASTSAKSNSAIPDIWSTSEVDQQINYNNISGNTLIYDPLHSPKSGDLFAIPDGRLANYINMDDRFVIADKYGAGIDVLVRHNLSASFIKDFEDIVRKQTTLQYDMYQMRYSAFMNKVHQLEHKFRGLDVSVYDILPVAERGLPQAPMDTIKRTNLMDKGSLKYIIDKVEQNKGHLNPQEKAQTMKDAAYSVIARTRAYNIEYQLYIQTQTNEKLCHTIHDDMCVILYSDFAKLDSLNELNFPMDVYRILCNGPEQAIQMTSNERVILRQFGQGYALFLKNALNDKSLLPSKKRVYNIAYDKLYKKYLSKI